MRTDSYANWQQNTAPLGCRSRPADPYTLQACHGHGHEKDTSLCFASYLAAQNVQQWFQG